MDSDDCIHPRLLESYRELDDDSVTLLCDYTTDMEEWKRFSLNDFQEHNGVRCQREVHEIIL